MTHTVNSRERFKLSEQRTVRTFHTVRKVRTAISANGSFFRNRRTERTGANTVRWNLPYRLTTT